ncbi:MAG: hypothetical protein IKY60_04300 [Bacteroidales bacterium]|nr:hypothetical protein [Bacteroidales bacterium]
MSEEGVNFKECLNCNKKFCGRTDKKFCSDYCRTSYNNHIYRLRRNEIYKIDKILKKNREILLHLYRERKYFITEEELNNLGFDLRHFTSLPENISCRRGERVLQCYDFILYIDKKHKVTISKLE